MPSVSQATPSIAFSGATVIATAEQQAGYVAGGTKSAQMSIPTNPLANISMSLNGNVVTAIMRQPSGYVDFSVHSNTLPLGRTTGRTWTPTSEQQVVAQNGTINIGSVIVSPIPSTYIQPLGTSEITANGVYDVRAFESASVMVTGGDIPSDYVRVSGTSEITANGVYDVRAFESASVNVAFNGIEVKSIAEGLEISLVSDDTVSFIASNAFVSMIVKSIVLNNATIVNNQAFFRCSILENASFEKATTLSIGAFQQCASLTTINCPNVETIGLFCFSECTQLKSIKLDKLAHIFSGAFNYCYALSIIDLRNVSSVPIASNRFLEYANSSCKIMVPASLYNAFVSANYWSFYSSNIVSV